MVTVTRNDVMEISLLLALAESARLELPSEPRAVHAVPPTSHSTADVEPASAQPLPDPPHQTFEWMLAHIDHHHLQFCIRHR